MQEMKEVNANSRERKAKGDNRRLRRNGRVPAVIYGHGGESQSVDVSAHDMEMILHGAWRSTHMINLNIDGKPESTLIRAIQRHPVSYNLLHLDFLRVSAEEEIEVEVPVHNIGSCVGVREGGVLEHLTRTVTVRCKSRNIPSHIDMDVSELQINQTMHVSDLKLEEGIEVMNEPDTTLFSVVPPRTATGDEAGEGGGDEPELIQKKKEDGA